MYNQGIHLVLQQCWSRDPCCLLSNTAGNPHLWPCLWPHLPDVPSSLPVRLLSYQGPGGPLNALTLISPSSKPQVNVGLDKITGRPGWQDPWCPPGGGQESSASWTGNRMEVFGLVAWLARGYCGEPMFTSWYLRLSASIGPPVLLWRLLPAYSNPRFYCHCLPMLLRELRRIEMVRSMASKTFISAWRDGSAVRR